MMRRRAFLALPAAAYAASKQLYARLLQSIERLDVIDTHEHILPESERVRQQVDFFTLVSHYALNDLSSAGLPAADRQLITDTRADVKEKWRVFAHYWPYTRNTGYGEALRIAIRDIYNVADIGSSTLSAINDAIRARNKPGLYKEILKTRSRIVFAMNDEYWQAKPAPVDPEFFALARKFDGFVMPITPEGLQRLESQTNVSISSLADLKRAMERDFQLALKVNMRAIKTTIAYQRDLHFPTTTVADASADFERLARGEGIVSDEKRRLERRPFRALSNHMFHHLVQLADAHSVPMQIHTGLQAGNGNFVAHSQPTQLSNIFLRYPRVQFDIFHIGFPYHHEVTVLAKMFPNVYADFCWMHIVSPSAARAALDEMLDSVPANKIFGFGGDYRYPELSYAHLVMARRNIATVLADRVEKGGFKEEEAAGIARWLLHDNPASLFAKQITAR
jgi:predicted TIM-barrel fold metal-dependent hydrolase